MHFFRFGRRKGRVVEKAESRFSYAKAAPNDQVTPHIQTTPQLLELFQSYATTSAKAPDGAAQLSEEAVRDFFDDLGLDQVGSHRRLAW